MAHRIPQAKPRDNKQLHGWNYYKMTAFRATFRTYNARKQQLKDHQQQHKEETTMQMKPSTLILAVLLLQASFIHGEERTHWNTPCISSYCMICDA